MAVGRRCSYFQILAKAGCHVSKHLSLKEMHGPHLLFVFCKRAIFIKDVEMCRVEFFLMFIYIYLYLRSLFHKTNCT